MNSLRPDWCLYQAASEALRKPLRGWAIEAAHRDYAAKGLGSSDISKGRIHDLFHLPGPDGYDFTVTSSHAGSRAV